MQIPSTLKPAVAYLKNAGTFNSLGGYVAILINDFDSDHAPIGPLLRFQLCEAGICTEHDNFFLAMKLSQAEAKAAATKQLKEFPPETATTEPVIRCRFIKTK